MAKATVSKEILSPNEKVWEVLANPSRFEEWNVLHTRWKDTPPTTASLGTRFTEVLTIMGMPNTIEFTTTDYDPPKTLTISGEGMAGAKITLTLSVSPSPTGSVATLDAEFISQMMVGAIGSAIERAAAKELGTSLDNLAALVS